MCVFVCVCVQENAEHMVSQSLGACPSLLSDKVSRQTDRGGGWKRGRELESLKSISPVIVAVFVCC